MSSMSTISTGAPSSISEPAAMSLILPRRLSSGCTTRSRSPRNRSVTSAYGLAGSPKMITKRSPPTAFDSPPPNTCCALTRPIALPWSLKCCRPSSTSISSCGSLSVRTMCASGNAYGSPPISASSVRTTDNVSGSCIWKRAPRPCSELTRIVPRTCFNMLCTTSRPTPRPEISVTSCFIVKPGRKRNS